MSLIAHYRLDGNAVDSVGGYNGTGSGTFSYIGGKLGDAFSTNSDSGFITTTLSDERFAATFSASAWVRIKEWGLSQGVFGTRNSPNGWMLYRNAGDSSGLLRFYMHYLNSSGQDATFARTFSGFPLNEWFHVSVTRGNGWIEIWFNGTKVSEGDLGSAFDRWNSDSPTPFRIGAGGSGWTTSQMDIDDVRIYDHALSLSEVKELSKAKVLHYNFNDFQEPTENILNNPLDPVNWTHFNDPDYGFISEEFLTFQGQPGYQRTLTGRDYRATRFDVSWNTPTDMSKELTASIWVRCLDPSDATDVYLNYQGTDSSGDRIDTGDTTKIDDSNWHRVFSTRTVGDEGFSTLINRMKFYVRAHASNPTTWQVVMPQVEHKPRMTEFVDGVRGSVYVGDLSGQGNGSNLTISTTPSWVEDSKLGKGAYEYYDRDSWIAVPSINSDDLYCVSDKQWTTSVWFKHFGRSDEGVDAVMGASGGFGGSATYALGVDGQGRIRVTLRGNSSFPASNVSDNEWHHVAITWDGSGALAFVDNNEPISLSVGTAASQGIGLAVGNHRDDTYSGGTNGNPFYGLVDDVRVYATALSPDDIKSIYNKRASVDIDGSYSSSMIRQNLNWDEDIQSNNLIENGNAEFKDNTHFTSFDYDPVNVCFSATSNGTYIGDQYVPIVSDGYTWTDEYAISCYVKGDVRESQYYFMISCYDSLFRFISYVHVGIFGDTHTTLAQDLNPGDQYVYLTNTANWQSDDASVAEHMRTAVFWGDSNVHPEIPYVYGRNVQRYDQIDYSQNRIRLTNSYSGEMIPAGSPAANSRSGGTYSYIGGGNIWTNLDSWEYREGSTGIIGVSGIRPGTSYIRIGYLANRNADPNDAVTLVKDLKVWNKTRSQSISNFVKKESSWDTKGSFFLNEYSEVGPSKGLIAWYPLDGDTKDYAGGNDGTNNGAVATTRGYEFDGVSSLVDCGNTFYQSMNHFSVSLWVWTDNGDADWEYFVHHSIGTASHIGGSVFTILKNSGNIRASINGTTYLTPNINITDSNWHHIVLLFDGGLASLYMDGDIVASNTITPPSVSSDDIIGIGGSPNNVGYRILLGKVSDVRFYDRALTEDEINILYEITNPESKVQSKMGSEVFYTKGEFKEF